MKTVSRSFVWYTIVFLMVLTFIPANLALAATVSLNSPSDGQAFTLGDTVSLSASATGVEYVKFYVGSENPGGRIYESGETYTTSWSSSGKKARDYTITAVGYSSGKEVARAQINIIIKASIIPVTRISLNKTSLTMKVGETATLVARVSPSDATNKSINWSSDRKAVATVDDYGNVIAVGAGPATITAMAADGSNKYAQCTVTVNEATVPVTSISLNKTSLTLTEKGATETLVATVYPPNATNKSIKWSSDRKAVATVSDSGVVTPVKAGTANITAMAADGSKKFAKCAVTVNPATPTTIQKYIKLSPSTIAPGGTIYISGSGLPVKENLIVWLDKNGDGIYQSTEPCDNTKTDYTGYFKDLKLVIPSNLSTGKYNIFVSMASGNILIITKNIIEVKTNSSMKATTVGQKQGDVPALKAPSSFRALAIGKQVDLRWKGVKGVNQYYIYRCLDSDRQWSKIATVTNQTTYSDNGVQPGTKYWYAVAAVNGSTVGNWSKSVLVLTKPKLPDVAEPDPSKAFKSMIVTYKGPFDRTDYAQEVYFKDKDTALKFADSLYPSKKENRLVLAGNIILGSAFPALGIATEIGWQLGNEQQEDLINKIKETAYQNNGKVYFFLKKSVVGRSVDTEFSVKAWDEKTLYYSEDPYRTYIITDVSYLY